MPAQVKCDGRPNGCRNCERLQLDCVGDDGSSAGRRPSLATLRKIRTYRSCTSCRLSKTKCNGDRPKCSRCAVKRVDCVYDGGSAPRWARSLDQSSSRGPESEASHGRSHSIDDTVVTAKEELDSSASPTDRGRASRLPPADDGPDRAPPTPSEPGASAGHLHAPRPSNPALDISPSDPLAW